MSNDRRDTSVSSPASKQERFILRRLGLWTPIASLNAIARFTSRRRVPKEIIRDNGKDFVGAVNELLDLVSHLDEDTTQGNEHV